MKKITQKEIKKQLIKIIKTQKIEDVIYEPRWQEGYNLSKTLIGSTLTIKTLDE